ncbi:MAG: hypothetical protein VCD34_03895 [Planctomycetota bacterium]
MTRNEKGVFVRTPAKLNLFLDVGAPGSDGYHPIDSIFQAVSLFDELDFVPAGVPGIELQEEGIEAGEENIVHRAASRLREEVGGSFPSGVRISLRKSIPCAAGLGGGSSDAAATLFALRELWDLPVDSSRLLKIGEELGLMFPSSFLAGLQGARARERLSLRWRGPLAEGTFTMFLFVHRWRHPPGRSTRLSMQLQQWVI